MKKLAVLVGVLALFSFGAIARADFALNFDSSGQVLPANTVVTNQYSSNGVTFYSGDISTLKTTYSWFPAYTFLDDGNNPVTNLLGPTFGTPTSWLDQENQKPTTYSSPAFTPTSNFIGFNKTAPLSYAGTVIKFNALTYSMSFALSRPGKTPDNSSNINIYLFNSTATGGKKLVAHVLDFHAYSGGGTTPEWVTYKSPQGSPPFDVAVIYSADLNRFMMDNFSASSDASVKLPSPIPLSPTDSPSIKVFRNVPRNTTVAWKPVANAFGYKVDLELKGTPAWPASPTTSVTVSDPKATSWEFSALPANGSYRWRVTALSAPGDVKHKDSPPSGWLHFNYASTVKLSVPIPISPIKNAKFYNDPRLTTLAWGPVPLATGYTVEVQYYDPTGKLWVADATDFPAATPLPDGSVEVTGEQNSSETFTAAFTPAAGATPAAPVNYQWRVTAKGDGVTTTDSNPSNWCPFNYYN